MRAFFACYCVQKGQCVCGLYLSLSVSLSLSAAALIPKKQLRPALEAVAAAAFFWCRPQQPECRVSLIENIVEWRRRTARVALQGLALYWISCWLSCCCCCCCCCCGDGEGGKGEREGARGPRAGALLAADASRSLERALSLFFPLLLRPAPLETPRRLLASPTGDTCKKREGGCTRRTRRRRSGEGAPTRSPLPPPSTLLSCTRPRARPRPPCSSTPWSGTPELSHPSSPTPTSQPARPRSCRCCSMLATPRAN